MNNNKISFTGIIYQKPIFVNSQNKIEKFAKDYKVPIKRIEEAYNTDIGINDKLDLTFIHKRYGNLGIKNFFAGNFNQEIDNICNQISQAISNIKITKGQK